MVATTPWLVYPKPNPQACLRLFCFPYAGAGASVFRTWPERLPPSIEVCIIQLPGRERRIRETPFTHLSPLIQTLAQVLLPDLYFPFAFFGHSVGALISFELARQLRYQDCQSPLHLFVSGRRAPQIPDLNPPIHQLSDRDLIAELRRFNGTPDVVLQNPDLMELFLPILRADIAINETYSYVPEVPLNCPISAFGGWQDRETNLDNLAAWRDQTCSAFTLRMFPGDHFYFKQECDGLLAALLEDLDIWYSI